MHTQDVERRANLAGAMGTWWLLCMEKLGRIRLITVFMMSPGHKY